LRIISKKYIPQPILIFFHQLYDRNCIAPKNGKNDHKFELNPSRDFLDLKTSLLLK